MNLNLDLKEFFDREGSLKIPYKYDFMSFSTYVVMWYYKGEYKVDVEGLGTMFKSKSLEKTYKVFQEYYLPEYNTWYAMKLFFEQKNIKDPDDYPQEKLLKQFNNWWEEREKEKKEFCKGRDKDKCSPERVAGQWYHQHYVENQGIIFLEDDNE